MKSLGQTLVTLKLEKRKKDAQRTSTFMQARRDKIVNILYGIRGVRNYKRLNNTSIHSTRQNNRMAKQNNGQKIIRYIGRPPCPPLMLRACFNKIDLQMTCMSVLQFIRQT